MSQEVFAALAKLDPAIANAYKRVLPSTPNGEIDEAGAKEIYKEVIDPMQASGKAAITSKEAQALWIVLRYAPLSKPAEKYIGENLAKLTATNSPVLVEALFEGGAAELLKGDKRDLFANMLDIQVVEKIRFDSPGTNVSYTPNDYFAIRQLIADGNIELYAVKDGELTNGFFKTGGMYRSGSDRLLIFAQSDLVAIKVMMVHESTHAVQDWHDEMGHPRTAIEADAYIAGAVALTKLKPTTTAASLSEPYRTAFEKAAPIVIGGKAALSNQKWKTAYQLVLDAVGKDQGFADAGQEPDKPGQNEKQIMNRILTEMKKKPANKPSKP